MGLFKKIKQIDKAVDDFIIGTTNNAISKVVSFAKTKDYCIKLIYKNKEIGVFEYTSSSPEYVDQKVNNYLSLMPSDCNSFENVKAYFMQLDLINVGVSSTAHPDHLTGLNPANEF